MLRIHFSPEDLARTTIAADADPMWELLLSLHLLQQRTGEVVYGAWRRQSRTRLPQATRLLMELAPPAGYSPDLLTPPGGLTDLDVALEVVRSVPRRQVQAQLERLGPRPTAWTRRVATADRSAMELLTQGLRSYHQRILQPYWQGIRDRVAADRTHRTRQLVQHGVDGLLRGLGNGTRWREPVLEVPGFRNVDLHLGGRGLTLQPSYFCWLRPTKLWDPELPQVLVYPIQHLPGELTMRRVGPEPALIALLGRSRATALAAIASGCSTTELARACGISPAAASHHASVLREAGLATTRRDGLAVRHEATALGLHVLHGRGSPAG
jgi:DNA-binding transcriptional ArsR family regulator